MGRTARLMVMAENTEETRKKLGKRTIFTHKNLVSLLIKRSELSSLLNETQETAASLTFEIWVGLNINWKCRDPEVGKYADGFRIQS